MPCRTLVLAVLLALAPAVAAQDPTPTATSQGAADRTPKATPPDPSKLAKPESPPETPPPHPPASDAPAARLPEVVVTPTRSARDPLEVPAAVRTLGGAIAFGERGARTVPEALGQLPGVGVQKTAQGQGTIFLRGLTGFRTLLLYDGMRLNNSIFRDGPNEYLALVDPFHLGEIEVVEGPCSVLYGSDAVGGSVNLRPRALVRGEGDAGWARRLAYRYGGADDSHTVRGEFTAWNGPLAVRVGGTWRDFDDLEGGRHTGVQPMTGFQSRAADASAEWTLSEHVRVRANVVHTTLDDVWRTHKTVFGISWHGTTIGNELARVTDYERTFSTVHVEADEAGWLRDVRVSLAAGCHLETQDRTKSSGSRDLNTLRVNTGAGAVQLGLPLYEGARLLIGADWCHDDVDTQMWSFSGTTGLLTGTGIQGVVADDARYDLVGAFSQLELPLGPYLELSGGVRGTWADVYAGAVQDPVTGLEISLDDTWTNVSGAGTLAWTPADTLRLFTGIAQSFRAPNLSDLTRLDEARSGEIETPSPGLRPEHYLTWEAGFKTRVGALELEGVYFYTWISDMIVRTPTGNLIGGNLEVTKTNVGDGYVQGASASLRYRFGTGLLNGVSAEVGAGWQQGAVDTYPTSAPVKAREPLSKLPPAGGFVRLRYESRDGLWHAEGEARFARAQERLSTADTRDAQRIPPGGTPGYAVFALRGGVRLAEGLTVDVGLENVGDRDYRYHGSGVNEAGAHAVLQVGWDF